MRIRRILYATKLRDLSFQALKELFVLKKVGLEEIILFHVIPREEVSYSFPGGYMKEEVQRLKAEVELRFETWGKEILKEWLSYRSIVRVGDPLYEIPAFLSEERVDLLVVGKKERETPFVSSRTKEILKLVNVPTLVFKYRLKDVDGITENRDIFRKPLLGIDFSEASLRAFNIWADLCGLHEGGIILHVISPERIEGLPEDKINALKEEVLKRLEALLEGNFQCRELMERIETLVLIGEPGSVILDLIADREASLVILGKSKKSFLDRLFLGSALHPVLDRAKVPVLVVP